MLTKQPPAAFIAPRQLCKACNELWFLAQTATSYKSLSLAYACTARMSKTSQSPQDVP